jgi:hypothetical protein
MSLTAGTASQDTRKPLRMWFLAMWFVTSQKNGVSALGLQRVLGLGSYETVASGAVKSRPKPSSWWRPKRAAGGCATATGDAVGTFGAAPVVGGTWPLPIVTFSSPTSTLEKFEAGLLQGFDKRDDLSNFIIAQRIKCVAHAISFRS